MCACIQLSLEMFWFSVLSKMSALETDSSCILDVRLFPIIKCQEIFGFLITPGHRNIMDSVCDTVIHERCPSWLIKCWYWCQSMILSSLFHQSPGMQDIRTKNDCLQRIMCIFANSSHCASLIVELFIFDFLLVKLLSVCPV